MRLLRYVAMFLLLAPVAGAAQEPLQVPSSASEPPGLVAEPDFLTRVVIFADRHLGKGDLTNGIYADYGNMIPGAGWLSIGPGCRQWYGDDSAFLDASASMSVNRYKLAQARFELPKFVKSRLALGTQVRWQDFGRVEYFGVGPDTTEDMRSVYGVRSTQLAGYATWRPLRWMALTATAGWMNPRTERVDGSVAMSLDDRRTFVTQEAALTIDTRDFPGHPTRGVVLRGVAARHLDQSDGVNDFDKWEGEAAGFMPLAGGRAVLALHGWVVNTEARSGGVVPFYLQPSLGGVNTLRSYSDYRFHDNAMAVANVELRLALMQHLDWAVFADAGNVAARTGDLDFARRSYGTGLRLHTRRETFAMVDVARGDEGWRVLFRLNDPLRLGRLARRTTTVPFVP